MELSLRIHRSVLYLRTRPMGTRHAILWGGSLVIFFAVSFLWVGQMKYKLATAFQFGPTDVHIASSAPIPAVQAPVASNPPPKAEVQLPAMPAQSETTPSPIAPDSSSSLSGDVSGIVGLIEKGTAGLFSLLQGKGIPIAPPSRQEGQELDQFLKYQQEYYKPLPANQ